MRPDPVTDAPPESIFAAPSTQGAQMVWGSDGEGSFEPPPPSSPAQRSAAALAAATNQLLEALVAKRVPRVDGLRRRLRQSLPGDLREIDEAVRLLNAEMGSWDFLAARGSERLAEFVGRAEAVIAASTRLATLAAGLGERHASEGPVVRLIWIELVLEADSLRKRVRQGAHWLAQMNLDLARRRADATLDMTRQALDELARRGTALHERLHTVHRLCGHARSIHQLCEQMQEQRTGLCAMLQSKVQPAAEALRGALQPLLEAASYRPLVPEELMTAIEAQHALQVSLTPAAAELARLEAGGQELAAQLAGMEQKANSLG